MEYGATKPIPPMAAAIPTARRQDHPEPVAETDLPPEKVVTAVKETDHARETSDSLEYSRQAPELERKTYRDTVTNSLVFREINPDSGEVVRQIPEDSLLRIRRYYDAYDQLVREAKVNRTA